MSRLIHGLGIRDTSCSRNVMALVDKDATVFLHAVGVRSARPHAHEDDATAATEPEIHAALQVHAFVRAHLQIGNDVALVEHGGGRTLFRAGQYQSPKSAPESRS